MYRNQQSTTTANDLAYHGLARAAGTPSRAERLAHCAGLFDGDGCVFISKQHMAGRKNPTYRLTLSLVQNCITTTQNFANQLGLPHCLLEIKRSKRHNRQIYDLRFDGRHALAALELLHPHLVRKRIEAEVAYEFWHACSMGVLPGPNGLDASVWKEREKYFRKLSALK